MALHRPLIVSLPSHLLPRIITMVASHIAKAALPAFRASTSRGLATSAIVAAPRLVDAPAQAPAPSSSSSSLLPARHISTSTAVQMAAPAEFRSIANRDSNQMSLETPRGNGGAYAATIP